MGLTPILFGLATHRWRGRVLDLHPTVGAAGSVGRTEPLRHDTLAAESAGVLVDDRSVARVVLVEGDAFMGMIEKVCQDALAFACLRLRSEARVSPRLFCSKQTYASACPLASRTMKQSWPSFMSGSSTDQGGWKRGDILKDKNGPAGGESYCAFGASDELGPGAAPAGAAFFFFFFFFGGSLGCCASDCWASAFDAVITEAGTAKLAARPTRRNSFRREITSGSLGLLMVNLSAFCA
jgi:hypothetical protein